MELKFSCSSESHAPMISVIVPCHNEAKSIDLLRDQLRAVLESYGEDFEIIFIDDGSTDDSLKVLRSIDDARVRYVSLSRNFGKESAMLAGLQRCRGSRVIIIDGDLQHPPEFVLKLLETQDLCGAEQVVARRIRTNDSRARKILISIYYWILNRLSNISLQDGFGDFRLLTRRAVDALLSITETMRFSKGLFSWIGFSMVHVDYKDQPRVSGDSKWSYSDLISYGIDGILSFNTRPLRSMTTLGFSTILMSSVYMVWLMVDYFINGIVTPGFLTLMAVTSFIGGVQLFSIGIVGEYVGRIFLESKKRPHFIVAEESEF